MNREHDRASDNDRTSDLERLLSLLMDGDCTEVQWEQLVQMLRDDSEAQQRYILFMALHGQLIWRFDHRQPATLSAGVPGTSEGIQPSHPAEVLLAPTPVPNAKKSACSPAASGGPIVGSLRVGQFLTWTVGIAAIIAVAWVVGWGWPTRHDAPDQSGMSRPAVTLAPPARPSAPATLTRSLLATWNPAYSALDAASLSVGQRLELQKGLAEITFASGAKLTLQAPMSLIITTSNAARLEAGQLTAEVPPAAAGFTLDVPTGKIIDRGTRFGVIVEKAPEATGGEIVEVHVLKGNVEVETEAQPGAEPSVTQLDVNQAVRSDTATRSLQRIPAEPARFISSINEPITLQSGDIVVDGPERTIRRVSDDAIFAAGINPRSDIKDLAFSADGAALYTIENRWKGSFGPTSKLIRIDVLDPGHPKEATRFRHWGIRLAGSPDGTLLACDLEPPKKNAIVVRLDPKQNYRRTTLGELPGTCNGLAVSPAGEIYAAVAQHFVARVDRLSGESTPVVSDIDPGSLAIDPANGDLLVGVALPAGSMEIRRYRSADQFRPVGNPLVITEKMTLRAVTARGMILATPVQGNGLWQIDPQNGERTLIYSGLVKAIAIYPSVK